MQLENWSKGQDSVRQTRQLCAHLQDSLASNEEGAFQIEDENCFFVVNEFLWTLRRPHQLRWHKVCYGFDPDTFEKIDTSLSAQRKREYYLMLDLNRCMYMVCPSFSSKIFVKSNF